MKVWDGAGIEFLTPGSAVRLHLLPDTLPTVLLGPIYFVYTRLASSEGSGETMGRLRQALAVCRCDKYQNLVRNLQQGSYRQVCVKFKDFQGLFKDFPTVFKV